MDNHLRTPKVYLRLPITKEEAESHNIHLRVIDNSSRKWPEESIAKLKEVLPRIKAENGTFTVNYNFTELSKSLGVEKHIIFNKVIELYHAAELKKQETTSHTKHARFLEHTVNSSTNTTNVLAMQHKSESTLTNNSSSLRQSLLDKLELLKLGGTQSLNSNSNSSVDNPIKQVRPSLTSSLRPPPGLSHIRIPDFDPKHNDKDPDGDNNDSDNSSTSSSPSVINMATASTYLHRSRLINTPQSHSTTHMDPESDDEDEDNEGYLLTGTSSSLPNSLLGEEALKML